MNSLTTLLRRATVVLLFLTAAAKLPLVIGHGRVYALDPVFLSLPHWKVLAVAILLEILSALCLLGVVRTPGGRAAPVLVFASCCVCYRVHLLVQGHSVCSCLGSLPQWTPWIGPQAISYVSAAMLGVILSAGVLTWLDDRRREVDVDPASTPAYP